MPQSLTILTTIGAIAFAACGDGGGAPVAPATDSAPPAAPPPNPTEVAREAVDDWLSLIDAGSYAEAYDTASDILKEQVTRDEFVSTYEEGRPLLGTVRSRVFRSATPATTLPGAPDGDYVVFEFDADYEQKENAVERVTTALEAGTWRVAGHWVLDPPELEGMQPDAASARVAVDEWLSLIDAGSTAEAYDMAASLLKEKVTRDEFVAAYQEARSLLGTVRSRVFRSATLTDTLPGAPPGVYVVVEFDADYERKENALERVTTVDQAKVWRVAGHWVLDSPE
ncbi:MAG: DUF4019 domain-containing protein [Acidobacteriota bacterium]|nr:DUF4019 domain-containing protein [Acidobacteriota bacterium]